MWDVHGLVARLCIMKSAGYPFDFAWSEAFKLFPPRASDLAVPSNDGQAALFDEDFKPETSRVEAMRSYCDDAWHGRKPGLRHFTVGMTVDLDLMGWEPEDLEVAA